MVALPPPTVLEAVQKVLTKAGAAAALEGLGDFLGRLDADYFEHEAPKDVALHARLAAELGPGRRARLAVTARTDGRYDVAVVAFDYFAELSILCGLLASHGLDIEAGHVHTLAAADATRPPARAGRPPRPLRPAPAAASRRIVDVFRVRPRDGRPPSAADLERELVELLDLVAQGRALEARERLNLRLVDALGDPAGAPAEAPAPVEIHFDNAADPAWTVMDVRGPDTPGFLYALANALAMRGIYIHRVRIVSRAGQADDRFLVARADGRKLEEAEQEELRWSVGLIKQFTHFLPWAPDPARALRYFDQFLDRVASLEPAARADLRRPEALRDLARLLGSSAFLWEDLLRIRLERLLPVLACWRTRPIRTRAELQADLHARLSAAPDSEAIRRVLDGVKDEELLLIDAKRLLDPDMTLTSFSAALADLAEALVGGAVEAVQARLAEAEGMPVGADGRECPLAVLALGKFGGREMGHASDLELLFVYGEAPARTRSGMESGRFFDELVRRFTELFPAQAEGIFHIDLRLRPHGGKGTLASPLWAVRDYYRPGGEAAPFERQALIKLRRVAGDEELGREVERVRDAFVWSGEPWDREAALHLRERQVRELVPPGRFNVKLSRGGLVDVEYTAQYIQVMHGRERLELRTPETLEALARLAAAGLLSPEEHHVLREGYLFWRSVIDGLRVVRGHAGDLLLPEPASDEYGFLARRLAYPGTRREAAAALAVDVERHRAAVAAVYDRRFRA